MAKQVYTVNGMKFKTDSQASADKLYAKDYGATPAASTALVSDGVIKDTVTGNSYKKDITGTYKPYSGAPAIDVGIVGANTGVTIPHKSNIDSTSAFIEGLKSSLSSTKEISESQKQIDIGNKRILSAYDKLGTKGARTQELYDEYGVKKDADRLKDLNLSIAQMTGEFDKLEMGLEGQGRGIPVSIITGQQGAVRRQKAVEVGAKAAVAAALQGNIELSMQLADRTVALEFEGVENDINRTQTFIQQNRDKMTAAQQEQADVLNLELEDRKLEIAEQKEDRKQVFAYATEAAQNGASAQEIQTIQKASSLEEAFRLAAPYIGKLDRLNQQSIMADRASGGSGSSSSAFSTANVNQAAAALDSTRGPDNYVDPTAYQMLYNNWIAAGGSQANFLTKFPPAKYVNPANDWLPAFLRPKAAANDLSSRIEAALGPQ